MKTPVCMLVSAALFGQPRWPQFRGPAASGVAASAAPVEWNVQSGKSILWKVEIPGLAHSSPVIWGDHIFLTTAVPEKGAAALKTGLYGDIAPVKGEGAQVFKVYCLDRKSGTIQWERTAVSRQPRVMRHPKSTHANPTPATDGKHVVALFGSEGMFAYDFKGKLLWQKDLGILDAGFYMVPAAQWGYASSPVIRDGKIIVLADVQKDSFLATFDVKTGKEIWRTMRDDVPTFGSPGVGPYTAKFGPKEQVVVNGWKHIAGYDLDTGKELWRMKGGGDIPVPTPVFSNGMVIITNAHGMGRPIYAIRTNAAGDLSEDRSAIQWSQDRAGNYMQTPLLDQGLGYFCFDNGVLTVYELETGAKVYQQRLGSGNSGFSSSPVAAGGNLYVTNEEGKTYVIALGREYKLVAENETEEQVMATPAVADGVIYLRGRNHLFAIGAKK